MRQNVLFVIALLLIIGCSIGCRPVFVHASDTCYVDKDGDDGDGSKDDPFQKIGKALDKDCSQINVAAGTYDESIEIGKNVIVKGESRDKVTIAGSVLMKDGVELSGVKVSGIKGVSVEKDAKVEIDNVAIVGAHVGIDTLAGNGKVTVLNTKIYDGGKGIYLQTGNATKITDCDIYGNDEEGIDIRSNVDGSIMENNIYNNGESGIEVILGKADLVISGNKIKKNDASGIAAQYYKGMGKSGAVKVKSNTISDNKQYGINCKTPSGDNPGKEFWDATMNLSSNKLSGNKEDFASHCNLSDATISDATMTQKQKEEAARKLAEEQKLKDEAVKKSQELKTQQQTEEEKKRLAEEEEQQKLREKNEKNAQLKNTAQTAITSMQSAYDADVAALDHIQERNAFVMFLIGPRMDDIRTIEARAAVYDKELTNAQQATAAMDDQTDRHLLQTQIDDLKKKKDDIKIFIEQQRGEFSLFGWMFD